MIAASKRGHQSVGRQASKSMRPKSSLKQTIATCCLLAVSLKLCLTLPVEAGGNVFPAPPPYNYASGGAIYSTPNGVAYSAAPLNAAPQEVKPSGRGIFGKLTNNIRSRANKVKSKLGFSDADNSELQQQYRPIQSTAYIPVRPPTQPQAEPVQHHYPNQATGPAFAPNQVASPAGASRPMLQSPAQFKQHFRPSPAVAPTSPVSPGASVFQRMSSFKDEMRRGMSNAAAAAAAAASSAVSPLQDLVRPHLAHHEPTGSVHQQAAAFRSSELSPPPVAYPIHEGEFGRNSPGNPNNEHPRSMVRQQSQPMSNQVPLAPEQNSVQSRHRLEPEFAPSRDNLESAKRNVANLRKHTPNDQADGMQIIPSSPEASPQPIDKRRMKEQFDTLGHPKRSPERRVHPKEATEAAKKVERKLNRGASKRFSDKATDRLYSNESRMEIPTPRKVNNPIEQVKDPVRLEDRIREPTSGRRRSGDLLPARNEFVSSPEASHSSTHSEPIRASPNEHSKLPEEQIRPHSREKQVIETPARDQIHRPRKQQPTGELKQKHPKATLNDDHLPIFLSEDKLLEELSEPSNLLPGKPDDHVAVVDPRPSLEFSMESILKPETGEAPKESEEANKEEAKVRELEGEQIPAGESETKPLDEVKVGQTVEQPKLGQVSSTLTGPVVIPRSRRRGRKFKVSDRAKSMATDSLSKQNREQAQDNADLAEGLQLLDSALKSNQMDDVAQIKEQPETFDDSKHSSVKSMGFARQESLEPASNDAHHMDQTTNDAEDDDDPFEDEKVETESGSLIPSPVESLASLELAKLAPDIVGQSKNYNNDDNIEHQTVEEESKPAGEIETIRSIEDGPISAPISLPEDHEKVELDRVDEKSPSNWYRPESIPEELSSTSLPSSPIEEPNLVASPNSQHETHPTEDTLDLNQHSSENSDREADETVEESDEHIADGQVDGVQIPDHSIIGGSLKSGADADDEDDDDDDDEKEEEEEDERGHEDRNLEAFQYRPYLEPQQPAKDDHHQQHEMPALSSSSLVDKLTTEYEDYTGRKLLSDRRINSSGPIPNWKSNELEHIDRNVSAPSDQRASFSNDNHYDEGIHLRSDESDIDNDDEHDRFETEADLQHYPYIADYGPESVHHEDIGQPEIAIKSQPPLLNALAEDYENYHGRKLLVNRTPNQADDHSNSSLSSESAPFEHVDDNAHLPPSRDDFDNMDDDAADDNRPMIPERQQIEDQIKPLQRDDNGDHLDDHEYENDREHRDLRAPEALPHLPYIDQHLPVRDDDHLDDDWHHEIPASSSPLSVDELTKDHDSERLLLDLTPEYANNHQPAAMTPAPDLHSTRPRLAGDDTNSSPSRDSRGDISHDPIGGEQVESIPEPLEEGSRQHNDDEDDADDEMYDGFDSSLDRSPHYPYIAQPPPKRVDRPETVESEYGEQERSIPTANYEDHGEEESLPIRTPDRDISLQFDHPKPTPSSDSPSLETTDKSVGLPSGISIPAKSDEHVISGDRPTPEKHEHDGEHPQPIREIDDSNGDEEDNDEDDEEPEDVNEYQGDSDERIGGHDSGSVEKESLQLEEDPSNALKGEKKDDDDELDGEQTHSENIKADLASRPLPPMLDQVDLAQSVERRFRVGKTNTNRNRVTKLNHKVSIKADDWTSERDLLNRSNDSVEEAERDSASNQRVFQEKSLPMSRKLVKKNFPQASEPIYNPNVEQMAYKPKRLNNVDQMQQIIVR